MAGRGPERGGAHGCGRLHVSGQQAEGSRRGERFAKTDAGVRDVDILPVLQGVLALLPRRGPNDLVFGQPDGADGQGGRVRATSAIVCSRRRSKRANERLAEAGDLPRCPSG